MDHLASDRGRNAKQPDEQLGHLYRPGDSVTQQRASDDYGDFDKQSQEHGEYHDHFRDDRGFPIGEPSLGAGLPCSTLPERHFNDHRYGELRSGERRRQPCFVGYHFSNDRRGSPEQPDDHFRDLHSPANSAAERSLRNDQGYFRD